MVYTSYFANIKKVPNPISISRFKPKWLPNVREYEPLMPPAWLINSYKNGHTSAECYTEIYKRVVLSKLDPKKVVQDITPLGKDPDVTLLCYEVSTEFCHRQIVAEWLRNNLIECQEYIYGQQLLF